MSDVDDQLLWTFQMIRFARALGFRLSPWQVRVLHHLDRERKKESADLIAETGALDVKPKTPKA